VKSGCRDCKDSRSPQLKEMMNDGSAIIYSGYLFTAIFTTFELVDCSRPCPYTEDVTRRMTSHSQCASCHMLIDCPGMLPVTSTRPAA